MNLSNFSIPCDCNSTKLTIISNLYDSRFLERFNGVVKQLVTENWGAKRYSAVDQNLALLIKSIKRNNKTDNNLRGIPDFLARIEELEKDFDSTTDVPDFDRLPDCHPFKDLCLTCSKLTDYITTQVNFGNFLLTEKEPRVSLFLLVCQKIKPFVGKFQDDLNFKQFFDELWRRAYNRTLPSEVLDLLSDVYPSFLDSKITELLQEGTVNDKLDEILIKYNENYLHFIDICQSSKKIFQSVTEIIKNRQIHEKFPEFLQQFLTFYLTDIKFRLTIREYRILYKDSLINLVIILEGLKSSGNDEKLNEIVVRELLVGLKNDNYDDFIIIVTHFPSFLYLINDKME